MAACPTVGCGPTIWYPMGSVLPPMARFGLKQLTRARTPAAPTLPRVLACGSRKAVRCCDGLNATGRYSPPCWGAPIADPFHVGARMARHRRRGDAIAAQTGQVLVVDAPAPGVGWP